MAARVPKRDHGLGHATPSAACSRPRSSASCSSTATSWPPPPDTSPARVTPAKELGGVRRGDAGSRVRSARHGDRHVRHHPGRAWQSCAAARDRLDGRTVARAHGLQLLDPPASPGGRRVDRPRPDAVRADRAGPGQTADGGVLVSETNLLVRRAIRSPSAKPSATGWVCPSTRNGSYRGEPRRQHARLQERHPDASRARRRRGDSDQLGHWRDDDGRVPTPLARSAVRRQARGRRQPAYVGETVQGQRGEEPRAAHHPGRSGGRGEARRALPQRGPGKVTVKTADGATVFDFDEWKGAVASRKNDDVRCPSSPSIPQAASSSWSPATPSCCATASTIRVHAKARVDAVERGRAAVRTRRAHVQRPPLIRGPVAPAVAQIGGAPMKRLLIALAWLPAMASPQITGRTVDRSSTCTCTPTRVRALRSPCRIPRPARCRRRPRKST